MVNEAGVVPTEDTVAPPVHIRVFVRGFVGNAGERSVAGRGDDLVERIGGPGDGAFGDEFCSDDTYPIAGLMKRSSESG